MGNLGLMMTISAAPFGRLHTPHLGMYSRRKCSLRTLARWLPRRHQGSVRADKHVACRVPPPIAQQTACNAQEPLAGLLWYDLDKRLKCLGVIVKQVCGLHSVMEKCSTGLAPRYVIFADKNVHGVNPKSPAC